MADESCLWLVGRSSGCDLPCNLGDYSTCCWLPAEEGDANAAGSGVAGCVEAGNWLATGSAVTPVLGTGPFIPLKQQVTAPLLPFPIAIPLGRLGGGC